MPIRLGPLAVTGRRAPHAHLEVVVLPAGRTHVVARVRGELDLATAGRLEDAVAVLAAEHGDVRLDLSEVGFADLTGLRTVLRIAAVERRPRVTVVASSPAIDRLIDVLADALEPL